jgi:hypothetical protein
MAARNEALRFDLPVEIHFGGQEISLGPLRGFEAIGDLEAALVDEVQLFRSRVGSKMADPTTFTSALLERGVDQARLLLLGAPGVITEQLLEQSTARERVGALTLVFQMNNLGRFVPFCTPAALIDRGMRLAKEVV